MIGSLFWGHTCETYIIIRCEAWGLGKDNILKQAHVNVFNLLLHLKSTSGN